MIKEDKNKFKLQRNLADELSSFCLGTIQNKIDDIGLNISDARDIINILIINMSEIEYDLCKRELDDISSRNADSVIQFKTKGK